MRNTHKVGGVNAAMVSSFSYFIYFGINMCMMVFVLLAHPLPICYLISGNSNILELHLSRTVHVSWLGRIRFMREDIVHARVFSWPSVYGICRARRTRDSIPGEQRSILGIILTLSLVVVGNYL